MGSQRDVGALTPWTCGIALQEVTSPELCGGYITPNHFGNPESGFPSFAEAFLSENACFVWDDVNYKCISFSLKTRGEEDKQKASFRIFAISGIKLQLSSQFGCSTHKQVKTFIQILVLRVNQ